MTDKQLMMANAIRKKNPQEQMSSAERAWYQAMDRWNSNASPMRGPPPEPPKELRGGWHD